MLARSAPCRRLTMWPTSCSTPTARAWRSARRRWAARTACTPSMMRQRRPRTASPPRPRRWAGGAAGCKRMAAVRVSAVWLWSWGRWLIARLMLTRQKQVLPPPPELLPAPSLPAGVRPVWRAELRPCQRGGMGVGRLGGGAARRLATHCRRRQVAVGSQAGLSTTGQRTQDAAPPRSWSSGRAGASPPTGQQLRPAPCALFP